MKTVGMAISMLVATAAYGAFSVDLPVVGHAAGVSTTFYTSIDVTNHTAQSTDVTFQYVANDLTVDASGKLTTLGAYGNLHIDDVLPYLASQGFLTSAQSSGTGTLLITFANASFVSGNEASAVARVYNYVTDGKQASVGLAYRGAVLRKNGSHSLVSVINNTTSATNAPSVVTNVGLENVAIDDAGVVQSDVITVKLTFYDPKTGNVVGSQPAFTLAPAQMVQVNDIWKSANLPSDATSLVMSATETVGKAQIRGYVVVKDTNTNDGAFFFME